jgi:hypothetical protein
MLDNIKEYLSALDIPIEQKRYAMNFCKKIDYLENLQSIAAQEVNEYVCTGYGNPNSKICFLFKDKETYDTVRPLVQDILSKFDINPWDVYITFVNKTSCEYSKKYSYLINEIHAVGSKFLCMFDNNDIVYKEVINEFLTNNVNLPDKYFLIDIQKLGSIEENVRQELWSVFRYLINYKTIN